MAIVDREMLTRQIRDATDIVELLSGYVTLRRAGVNFKGLCPFHEEKTPSFHVHPGKQIFKCYGCGAGGDVFTFLQMREKVDFLEARRMLADRAGISIEALSGGNQAGPSKTDLSRVNQWAQRVFRRNYDSAVGEAARAYVAKRGISAESSAAFGLGLSVDSFDSLIRQAQTAKASVSLLVAAGLARESQRGGYYDVFRNRLMFPISDATGRIIGFGGRTMADDPAKYLNTPATALFDKSTHLFGLDRARQAIGTTGRAIVVEGYTDCIMAHQHGFTETVATLGTAMTDAHAQLLRRYTDRVVLLFDSDEAGQRAADRALSVTLTSGLDVVLARVPEGKDPCDYLLSAGKTGFDAVLKAATPALEFKWHLVARQYEASATGPGRRRAIEEYMTQLSAWLGRGAVDPIQMGLLVNQLSKILSLPVEELHQRLLQTTRRLRPQQAPAEGSAQGTAPARASSAEQEALRQILEVLLNEPERYADVSDLFDPASIGDPSMGAVAKAFMQFCSTRGPDAFRLDELIGEFELPSFGQLITDLQMRGERRGKYEEVIRGARECLETAQRTREAALLAQQIRRDRQHTGEGPPPDGEDQRLLALGARTLETSRERPSFLPTKMRRKYLT